MKKLFLMSITVFLVATGFSQELPMQPERIISFTTDEGSRMNIDVSPDGKTLVFDMLGDIYTVPATGGKATQITKGLALNIQPVWSPDGKKIAFISDRTGDYHIAVKDLQNGNIITVGSDTKPLEDLPDLLWTPDGNFITIGDRSYGLLGGKIISDIKQEKAQNKQIYPIRYSQDGRFVYYVNDSVVYKYDQHNDTSMLIASFSKKPYQECSSAISPDGRYFVYSTHKWDKDRFVRPYLYALDLQNGYEKILASKYISQDSSFNFSPPKLTYGNFSPDSKYFYAAYGGKIHRIDMSSGSDVIIPFTANVEVAAASLNYNEYRINTEAVDVRYTRGTRLSPDKRQIVFSALGRLYIKDLPDGEPHPLINQPGEQLQPAYSPDGKWIAYVSWSDKDSGYVWKVPVKGGKPVKVSKVAGQYQRPTWSPDGKYIAVVHSREKLDTHISSQIGDLELVDVTSGEKKRIDSNINLWNEISFSKDGKQLYYEPTRKRDDSISIRLHCKDLETNETYKIAIAKEKDFEYFHSVMISPDGRFIAYTMGQDIYLVMVNENTQPAVVLNMEEPIQMIRFAQGVDPHWEDGGKLLTWTYANQFFQIDPEKVVKAAQTEVLEKGLKIEAPYTYLPVWVEPDVTITNTITAPYHKSNKKIALTNARIITMNGDKVIENGTILIDNERITAIGTINEIKIPGNTKVYNVAGATIIPGFVDVHAHLFLSPDLFNDQSWSLRINLAYGLTTARDPSTRFDYYGYEEMLKTGKIIGPRLYASSRPVLGIKDGLSSENLEDARAIVNKRKVMNGLYVKQYLVHNQSRTNKQWLAMACREAKMNMVCEGNHFVLGQIGMIKDGSTGIEHNPVWGEVYNDVIQLYAKSGTCLGPALQAAYGKEQIPQYFNKKYWQDNKKVKRFMLNKYEMEEIENAKPIDSIADKFVISSKVDARIVNAGGHVALGSHGENQGIGVHNELWAMQMGGLTNMQALRCATLEGARALGLQRDLGSIEVGKIADLIILNKNPLDDIHNSREIRYVMKDGIMYDGETLNVVK